MQRVLIQKEATREFLHDEKSWSESAADAIEFESIVRARQYCEWEHLDGVRIALVSAIGKCDLAVPARAASKSELALA